MDASTPLTTITLLVLIIYVALSGIVTDAKTRGVHLSRILTDSRRRLVATAVLSVVFYAGGAWLKLATGGDGHLLFEENYTTVVSQLNALNSYSESTPATASTMTQPMPAQASGHLKIQNAPTAQH